MEKPVLNFTASKIALAERKHNDNFFDALGQLAQKPSISALLFLFNAGGGTDAQFDTMFKEGVDTVMVAIIDGLSEGGFLEKEAVEQVKEMMSNIKNDQKASPSSGETTKK